MCQNSIDVRRKTDCCFAHSLTRCWFARAFAASPEQAQTAIAYISLAQASVGHPFTQETMDMYEFTSAVEAPVVD